MLSIAVSGGKNAVAARWVSMASLLTAYLIADHSSSDSSPSSLIAIGLDAPMARSRSIPVSSGSQSRS
jgi:hypothetical protein